ncbi:MAG: CTP synthase [Phycisphaerales bacterium]|nr:CTP synthase [Phycisphaerales bacterium]
MPDRSTARSPHTNPALLAQFGAPEETTEYYSPVPKGYQAGRHRYVAVFGTVMSGLGKGIFSSSIAKLLKDKGLSVAPIKLEGYLNIDAGTLNPYRHGEVFVLDDGTECDMDLGTYERILDQNLSLANFTTAGRIYSTVLERERLGGYLGRDVQMIPHVTGEVKRLLRQLAMTGAPPPAASSPPPRPSAAPPPRPSPAEPGEGVVGGPADVVFVEVGGTAGDFENGFYIEALRELAFEEGPGSVCFVALTYVIEPEILGEQKSKAAQLGIKRLLEVGIQPHIVACRAKNPVTNTVRQKIAMFSNVPLNRTFSMHDRESIYVIPDALRAQGLDRQVLSILNLHDRVNQVTEDAAREKWGGFVASLTRPKKHKVTIGITGKYAALRDAYASIDKALEHCSAELSAEIDVKWIDTTEISEKNVAGAMKGVNGIIVPGGFGARGVEGKIACARHCRENHIPYMGICLGFQVAVIEYARNVLGLSGANSTEFDADCADPVISELPEQKQIEGLGGTMRLGGQEVVIEPDTLAAFLYADSPQRRAAGPQAPGLKPHGEAPRELSRRTGEQEGKALQAPSLKSQALFVRERFRHRYEVEPKYVDRFQAAGMIFSGRHPKHPIMQVLELRHEDHPYFIGGQFHPELTSRPLFPNPLFAGLIAAAAQHARQGLRPEEVSARWLRPFVPSTSAAAAESPAVSIASPGLPTALSR